MRFTKRDRLRFISHLDLMQTFERALRRAGWRVAHTEGFNPRPKLTFAIATPLGIASCDEIVDIELLDEPDAADVLVGLRNQLPPGLDALECRLVAPGEALRVTGCDYAASLQGHDPGVVAAALERWQLSPDPVIVRERKGRLRDVHLARFITNARLEDDQLLFTVNIDDEGSAKPSEWIQWLGLDPAAFAVTKLRTNLMPASPEGGRTRPDRPEACPPAAPEAPSS